MRFVDNPEDLLSLFAASDIEDIDVLVGYLTDNGNGRISLSDETCKRLINAKESRNYSTIDLVTIASEIRLFGGNTLANLYRDARWTISSGSNFFTSALDKILPDSDPTIDYAEIVKDIADKLNANYSKNDSVVSIETAIIYKVLDDAFSEMSPEEKKEFLDELGVSELGLVKQGLVTALLAAAKFGKFKTFKLTLIVANAISKAILGKGLTFAGNRMLMKGLKVAMGPVGWVITGIWTVADMSSPAYRVTLPCVIQIAFMRQKAMMEFNSCECEKCNEINDKKDKFCSSCGAAMQSK